MTVPNATLYDRISFRLIGILSSLTYFRALRNAK
jgi:hypothetical protein